LGIPYGVDVLAAEREEVIGDDALEVLKAWCEVRTGKTPGPSDVAEEWRRPCRAQLGHELSMGRLLEKLGPELYSPECVEGKFSEVELRMVGVLQSSKGYPLRRCADLRKLLCYICRIARGGGVYHLCSSAPLKRRWREMLRIVLLLAALVLGSGVSTTKPRITLAEVGYPGSRSPKSIRGKGER
jgi:hypothetical protein